MLKFSYLLLGQSLLLLLVILTVPLGCSANGWLLDAPILDRVVYYECEQNEDKVVNPLLEDVERELDQLDAFPIAGSDVIVDFKECQFGRLSPIIHSRQQLIRLVVGEHNLSEDSEQDEENEELDESDYQVHFQINVY